MMPPFASATLRSLVLRRSDSTGRSGGAAGGTPSWRRTVQRRCSCVLAAGRLMCRPRGLDQGGPARRIVIADPARGNYRLPESN
jgi:hypothetical protein